MTLNFAPAVRREALARVAIIGPTGAGKTWTALEWASTLGDRIGVIDTENGSASLYSDTYKFDTAPWGPPYDATRLAAAVQGAGEQFDVLVVDSLTHFWQGTGGVLDQVEKAAEKNRGNQFAGWKVGTPIWRGLLDALIFAPCHIIVTMRSKMDYVQVQHDGRTKVEKIGMAPVARNDVEYEFTVVGELDQGHRLTITKSRCGPLADQVAAPHQAAKLATVLREWLATADHSPGPTPTEYVPERLPAAAQAEINRSELPTDPNAATEAQIKKMAVSFTQQGIKDRGDRIAFINLTIGREVESSRELTKAEAAKVIDALVLA
jgi:hypothetical protein